MKNSAIIRKRKMRMKINRKAMTFTLIALFFSLLAVSAGLVYTKYRERERSLSVESRIFSINSFITDSQRDMQRALYIASFRAFLGMTEHMASNLTYVQNMSGPFHELMLYGTLGGQPLLSTNDSHFSVWMQKVSLLASQTGIIANASSYSSSVSQSSPWEMDVVLNFTFYVADASGLASWTRNETVTATIPVEGLEDPLYIMGSDGVVSNLIIRTPYTFFINSTTNNATNLLAHVTDSYYVESDSAPDYLMRLAGDFSPSSNGIESLVNAQSLVVIGQYQNKSIVDYIYWSSSNPAHYRVTLLPSWFRLDNQSNHIGDYQADGFAVP